MSRTERDESSGVGTLSAPWSLPDRIALKYTFLGIIRRAHRHVLDDLDARAAGAEPLERAVHDWATAWYLDAAWLNEVALDTLAFWRDSPEARTERFIAYPIALHRLPSGTVFKYQPWSPETGVSESEHNDQLVRAFRAHLHQEALRTQADRREKGFIGPEDRPSHFAHLSWFALWQLEGMTAAAIAKAWRSERRETYTANAIHKAITEAATELGIKRRPGRRGRPRKATKV